MEEQKFDYMTGIDLAGEIGMTIEKMNSRQLMAVQEAMEKICQETEQEKQTEIQGWFSKAAVPILKNFAEQSSATLEIKEEREGMIEVVFRNVLGYDITAKDTRMRMLLILASHISIEIEDDISSLILAYDYKRYAN